MLNSKCHLLKKNLKKNHNVLVISVKNIRKQSLNARLFMKIKKKLDT